MTDNEKSQFEMDLDARCAAFESSRYPDGYRVQAPGLQRHWRRPRFDGLVTLLEVLIYLLAVTLSVILVTYCLHLLVLAYRALAASAPAGMGGAR